MTELLTIPEFCRLANTGRTNAYRLINELKLPAVKLGKKTLIRRSDMEAWVASLHPYSPKAGHNE